MDDDKRDVIKVGEEPLISTDVDKLIKIISEKKRTSIGELQSACGINRRALDKWIRVLEDEGYIRIEYGLTGTYVRWIAPLGGEASEEMARDDKAVEEEYTIQDATTDMYDAEDGVHAEKNPEEKTISETKLNEQPVEIKEESKDSEDEDYTPEELLHRYVIMKRREENKEEDIKSSILRNYNKEDEEDYTVISEEEIETPAGIEEDVENNEAETEKKEEEDKPIGKIDDKSVSQPPKTIYDNEVRKLLNSYVNEINQEKAKLKALEKEKEELYRDKIISLEAKMESDMATLTQYILKHENKLLEMKERVLELPDKVEEIVRLQTEIKNLEVVGRKSLKETREKVEAFLAEMKRSENELRGRINETKAAIEREESKIEELYRIRDSVSARAEKILASFDGVKERIEELNKRMEDLESELHKTISAKQDIERTAEALRQELEEREQGLNSLEEDLDGVIKLEGWAREYINDYENKIDEIDSFIRKSDEELAALREAAEASYLKRYIDELEGMASNYEEQITEAEGEEAEIETKIAETKKRLASLIKESQEMLRRLRAETAESPNYEELKKKIEERAAKAKKIVEEKARERERLLDESRKRKVKKKNEKRNGKSKK